MNAASILSPPRFCSDCGHASVESAPSPICINPTHWRIYCNIRIFECDVLRAERGRLLRALQWTATATAFLPGGSLRREFLRRGIKKLLERAKVEGWT